LSHFITHNFNLTEEEQKKPVTAAERTKILMTHRYFINPYPEYDPHDPASADLDVEEIKKLTLPMALQSLKGLESKNNMEGGIYVGAAGIVYMLIHMAKSGRIDLPASAKFSCYQIAQRALETQHSYYRNHTTQK